MCVSLFKGRMSDLRDCLNVPSPGGNAGLANHTARSANREAGRSDIVISGASSGWSGPAPCSMLWDVMGVCVLHEGIKDRCPMNKRPMLGLWQMERTEQTKSSVSQAENGADESRSSFRGLPFNLKSYSRVFKVLSFSPSSSC